MFAQVSGFSKRALKVTVGQSAIGLRNLGSNSNGVAGMAIPRTCSCCSAYFCTRPQGLSNGAGAQRSFQAGISRLSPTKDTSLDWVLEKNKKFVAEQEAREPGYWKRVGGPQKPRYLYIGCSDSRVPANQLMGLGPGEVFVTRNIGNLMVATDLNALAVVEYSVQHLGVQDILVVGHYDCGAVRASLKTQDLGTLENWLRCIRDVHRLHADAIAMFDNDEDKHKKLVELNAIEQAVNVYKTAVVQRIRAKNLKEKGEAIPRIHACVFNPTEGILHKLPVNYPDQISNIKHIYDLYA